MHPRNVYRNPPDFKDLAIKYPNFCKYVKIGLSGKGKLDFKNPEALAELTKTLLHHDFNLSVEIPPDRLVPTLPLRLNYILWIEDLLGSCGCEDIHGIDVGTGASCVYPLLGAQKGWHMLGTEIDESSVQVALRNVVTNRLGHLIDIKLVNKSDSVLIDAIDQKTGYSFVMCNPPFFARDEKPANRTMGRKPPSNARTGVKNELETDGGEVSFVQKILEESYELQTRILIFSTMLGKQSSLKTLLRGVQNLGVKSYAHTEFRQGKTTRWGLAWSFTHILPEPKKSAKPLVFDLPAGTNFDNSVKIIQKLLTDLKMNCSDVEVLDKKFTVTVSAFENTWANQRRKRREQDRNEPPAKKLKSDLKILEFVLKCYEVDGIVSIEAKWSSGSVGKDGVHQILQYFKNNWKIET